VRRKLTTETRAPAIGPKKKAMRPATAGWNGGVSRSASSTGPTGARSLPGSIVLEPMLHLGMGERYQELWMGASIRFVVKWIEEKKENARFLHSADHRSRGNL